MTPRTHWSRWWLTFALLLAIPAMAASWRWRRQYRTIRPDEPLIPASSAGKFGFVATDGVAALPFAWQLAGDFDVGGLASVMRDDKSGWIDRSGRSAIPCEWNGASHFGDHGMATVRNQDGLWGVIDRTGRTVIPCTSNKANVFDAQGWSLVQQAPQGVNPVPPRFTFLRQGPVDAEELALAAKAGPFPRDRPWGWVDRTGKTTIPLKWSDAEPFDARGWARVKQNDRWGWIDRSGKLVLPPSWEQSDDFDGHGWARVKKDGRWGWIDRTGKLALPCEWQDSRGFDQQGWAAVRRNGFWGWIDRTGKTVLDLQWQDAGSFNDHDWAWVMRRDRWGAIDRTGKLLIPCQWQTRYAFDAGGLAGVVGDGGYGWIDRTGQLAIPCQWHHVGHFNDHGTAWVQRRLDRRVGEGVIDRSGQEIVPAEWDHVAFDDLGNVCCTRDVHPWLKQPWFAWLAQKTGLDKSAAFHGLCEIRTPQGRLIWRSDLHALRFLLPWGALFFGLLSAACVRFARPRRGRTAKAAAAR